VRPFGVVVTPLQVCCRTVIVRAKLAWNLLTIVEHTGARHEIELEPGKPFFGFLNAVMAARKR